MNKNIWMDGIIGVVVGDALGSPAQFKRREVFWEKPITKMEYCDAFDTPPGSWTDDSSLTLATLDSLIGPNGYDLYDIADKYVAWLKRGEYTPFGYPYDIGGGCRIGIEVYKRTRDPYTSGGDDQMNNGNGSLMRSMPICLYAYVMEKNGKWTIDECIKAVQDVSGITHRHIRAKMACGLYFFMVKHLVNDRENKPLITCLQEGIDEGLKYYGNDISNLTEMAYFGRLFNLTELADTDVRQIKSSGYVIDTIEASVWSLITTYSYKECELKAVNLGEDADTVGAIAGGLAGLYYGYENIPDEWVSQIQRIEWIKELCDRAKDIS